MTDELTEDECEDLALLMLAERWKVDADEGSDLADVLRANAARVVEIVEIRRNRRNQTR